MTAPLSESKMYMANFSNEYKEAWEMFKDQKTIKCLESCMLLFMEIKEEHLKIMGDNIPLVEYRSRLQMILAYLNDKGDLNRVATCLEAKVLSIAKTTGTESAYFYLAQAVIKFLVFNRKIFVRRVIHGPTSGEDGAYVI